MKKNELFYSPEDVPIPLNRQTRYDMFRNPERYNNFPVITFGKRRLSPRAAFDRWCETCGGAFKPAA